MDDTTQSPLTERFDLALAYANALHRGDLRKGTTVPYVAHLLGVCSLVLENGADEAEAIAALLHDAAEDHGGVAQVVQITKFFGEEIARIVQECSDTLVDSSRVPKPPWFERKRAYVAHLKMIAPSRPSTVLVSCADKLYNLRSIDYDRRRPLVGELVYERFTGKKAGTLWYYRELADTFVAVPGRHSSLAVELAALAERLGGGQSASTLLEAYQEALVSGVTAAQGAPA
ncbi:MAG: HD domain-containing protein [Vulcanimicrobiaceae bacterium]